MLNDYLCDEFESMNYSDRIKFKFHIDGFILGWIRDNEHCVNMDILPPRSSSGRTGKIVRGNQIRCWVVQNSRAGRSGKVRKSY